MSPAHKGVPTPAVVALVAAGIPHTLHPYEHDPASDLGYGLEAVYVSGGRRGLDIGLAPADLVRATAAITAPIARHD